MYPLLELGFDFLILLGEACVFFAPCWLIAKKIDNWSIVDVAWSYGFALVGLQVLAVHFFVFPLAGQGVLMAVATVLWSLRLGTHLARRVLGHLDQEDGRYLKMRAEHGDRMPAQMAYFYFIQALVLTVLCLPLLSSNPTGASGPAKAIHWIGLGVVGLALLIETIADAQLAAFKKAPANKGQVCERGLWAWSRHPNYFGEWLVWVGFLLMSYNSTYRGVPGLLCVGVIYYFLTRVTGIPLTEEQALRSRGDAYRHYQKTTSIFIPWFPKKS
jgi:steroid 5-alpha reductase family enzyme